MVQNNKDFFELHLEDGSDVKYNYLGVTTGDDLIYPLTSTLNDDKKKFTVKGYDVRLPINEVHYVSFDISDVLEDYQNVLAQINFVVIDEENSENHQKTINDEIIYGSNDAIQMLDSNNFIINQLNSNETNTIRFAVLSSVKRTCAAYLTIFEEEYSPSTVIFKDLPQIKLSIEGPHELNFNSESKEFTLRYKVQNLSNIDGEDIKFKIKEQDYFEKISINNITKKDNNSYNEKTKLWTFSTLEANSQEYIIDITYKAIKKGIYTFSLLTYDSDIELNDDVYYNIFNHQIMINIDADIHITTSVSTQRPYANDIFTYKINIKNYIKEQKKLKFLIKDIFNSVLCDINNTSNNNKYIVENINCEYGEFIINEEDNNIIGEWQIDKISINKEYNLILILKPQETGIHNIQTIFSFDGQKDTTKCYINKVKVLKNKNKISFDVKHAVDINEQEIVFGYLKDNKFYDENNKIITLNNNTTYIDKKTQKTYIYNDEYENDFNGNIEYGYFYKNDFYQNKTIKEEIYIEPAFSEKIQPNSDIIYIDISNNIEKVYVYINKKYVQIGYIDTNINNYNNFYYNVVQKINNEHYDISYGYYKNNNFYQTKKRIKEYTKYDDTKHQYTYENIITPNINTIYIDLNTTKIYKYNNNYQELKTQKGYYNDNDFYEKKSNKSLKQREEEKIITIIPSYYDKIIKNVNNIYIDKDTNEVYIFQGEYKNKLNIGYYKDENEKETKKIVSTYRYFINNIYNDNTKQIIDNKIIKEIKEDKDKLVEKYEKNIFKKINTIKGYKNNNGWYLSKVNNKYYNFINGKPTEFYFEIEGQIIYTYNQTKMKEIQCSCSNLTEICDEDFVSLNDPYYYIIKVTNNSKNIINNVNVNCHLPIEEKIDNSFNTCNLIYFCDNCNPTIEKNNNLINIIIDNLKPCETKKFCIKIIPLQSRINYSHFILTTKDAKIKHKQLKMTVNDIYPETQLEHNITIYNFEKTNRYVRQEIDNNNEIYRFFNQENRATRMVDVEKNQYKALEKYTGQNLKQIYQQIKETSKYVQPEYIRPGNNELKNTGYEIYPDGFIRRFGLLNSEIFHNTGQLPRISNLVDYVMQWDVDNWDSKVWADGIYDNGVFGLSVDYSKIPSNFNILDVNKTEHTDILQNLVNKTKPYGTRGVCYYEDTIDITLKTHIDVIDTQVQKNIKLLLDINDFIWLDSWYNLHDSSIKASYNLILSDIDMNVFINNYYTAVENPKTSDYSLNTNIHSVNTYVLKDSCSIKKETIKDYDIMFEFNDLDNFDIFKRINTINKDGIYYPFEKDYDINKASDSFLGLYSDSLIINKTEYQYLYEFNTNIKDKTEFGIYLKNHDKDEYIKIVRYMDNVYNLNGFKIIDNNNNTINSIHFDQNIYNFNIIVQRTNTNYLHFFCNINNDDKYYHIGYIKDYNVYNQHGITCVKYTNIKDEFYSLTNVYELNNDSSIIFKIKDTINIDIVQPNQIYCDSKKTWNYIDNINNKSNTYAYFKNNAEIDKECDKNNEYVINTPPLLINFDNINIDKNDNIEDISIEIKAQTNKENLFKDSVINIFNNGSSYLPNNNISTCVVNPTLINNLNESQKNIILTNDDTNIYHTINDVSEQKTLLTTIPIDGNTLNINDSKEIKTKINIKNNNSYMFYYCPNCNKFGFGNIEQCPNCQSQNVNNYDMNGLNIQFYVSYQKKNGTYIYKHLKTQNHTAIKKAVSVSCDILPFVKDSYNNQIELILYVENTKYREQVNTINNLDIDEENKEEIINDITYIDIDVKRYATVEHVFINNNKWEIIPSTGDYNSFNFKTTINNNTTKWLRFEDFNIKNHIKNKNQIQNIKLYIDGINNSNSPVISHLKFINHKTNKTITTSMIQNINTHIFEECLNLTDRNIEINELYNDNFNIDIQFELPELSNIIINNVYLVIEYKNNNINIPPIDKKYSPIIYKNNIQYNLSNIQNLHQKRGYELSGGISAYIDFGQLKDQEYIYLYDINLIIKYKNNQATYDTEYLSFKQMQYGAQEINAKVNGEAKLFGAFQKYIHWDEIYGNIDFEEDYVKSNINIKNKVYQSFIAETENIAQIELFVNGKINYPDNNIIISLYNNYKNQPGKLIKQQQVEGWSNLKGRFIIDFIVHNLSIGNQYWFSIQVANPDLNNYYCINYQNNDNGQLLIQDEHDLIKENNKILSFNIYDKKNIYLYNNLPKSIYIDDGYYLKHTLFRHLNDVNKEISDLCVKYGEEYISDYSNKIIVEPAMGVCGENILLKCQILDNLKGNIDFYIEEENKNNELIYKYIGNSNIQNNYAQKRYLIPCNSNDGQEYNIKCVYNGSDVYGVLKIMRNNIMPYIINADENNIINGNFITDKNIKYQIGLYDENNNNIKTDGNVQISLIDNQNNIRTKSLSLNNKEYIEYSDDIKNYNPSHLHEAKVMFMGNNKYSYVINPNKTKININKANTLLQLISPNMDENNNIILKIPNNTMNTDEYIIIQLTDEYNNILPNRDIYLSLYEIDGDNIIDYIHTEENDPNQVFNIKTDHLGESTLHVKLRKGTYYAELNGIVDPRLNQADDYYNSPETLKIFITVEYEEGLE